MKSAVVNAVISIWLLLTFSLAQAGVVFEQQDVQNNARLLSLPFEKNHSEEASAKKFEYLEGQEIGVDKGFMYGMRDYTDPFWFGRGTASGDIDKDGWQDLVLAGNRGLFLYKNVGGHFERQEIIDSPLLTQEIFAVALVDLNNDGWLDLFYTTFDQGNYLILNRDGHLNFTRSTRVPNNNALLTLSPAFGDIDGDGYLDIVNGNVALGVVTGFHYMKSRRNNSIVFNGGLVFRDIPLEQTSGETMASLVSDINNDDVNDIYFGNDFFISDKLLLGTGRGFQPVKGNTLIPYTPFYSMGADSGDINNDLQLDLVLMGTMSSSPRSGSLPIDGLTPAQYRRFKGGEDVCRAIKNPVYRDNCKRLRSSDYVDRLDSSEEVSMQKCQSLSNDMDAQFCYTKIMWQMITSGEIPGSCQAVYGKDERLLKVCRALKLRGEEYDRRNVYGQIPQDDRNMLYVFNPAVKQFNAVDSFSHPGGWTWSARIVDLDNDGWQDVFNVEGAVRKSGYGWNVFMKNIDGKKFEQKQFSYGLVSDFGLYSFVLIDFDNDGDLDVIGNGAEGPVQVFRNNIGSKNNRIAVSLSDVRGNSQGLGAKVYIDYGGGQHQMREIKIGAGYLSFDAAMAWFGLGQQNRITKFRVLWPDKSETVFSGNFVVNRHYRIER